jgi:hypothetical protein
VTWQEFKNAFRLRFGDIHTDQYHYMKLQNPRQGKNDSPQQFADRCSGLAHKIMLKQITGWLSASIGKMPTECSSLSSLRD